MSGAPARKLSFGLHASIYNVVFELNDIKEMSNLKSKLPSRRRLWESVRTFSERIHAATLVFAIFFLLISGILIALEVSGLAKKYAHVAPEAETASRRAEKGLLGLDIAGLLVFGMASSLRKFGFRPAARAWRHPLARYDLGCTRKWLHGATSVLDRIDDCKVTFVSPSHEDLLTQLNSEGFRGSAFEVEDAKLRKRNQSWISKNDKIFMLIENPLPEGERYIGFSAFVPLRENGAELYRAGSLSDADIPVELICAADEPPAAVLLFAIMLRPEFSLSRTGFSKHFYGYFQLCIAHHLQKMYEPWLASESTPALLAQTEEISLKRKLHELGFLSTRCKTADGYELLELKNPFRVVQDGRSHSRSRWARVALSVGIALLIIAVVLVVYTRSKSEVPPAPSRSLLLRRIFSGYGL